MKNTFRLHFICLLGCWTLFFLQSDAECPFPKKKLSNGRILYQSSHDKNLTSAPENYLLRFRCSNGYVLRGAQAILCESDSWTEKLPRCIKLECTNPPPIDDGKYSIHASSSDLAIGSTVKYSCEVGFELENETTSELVCSLHEKDNRAVWNGDVPKCKKKESCPDPGVSSDGQREGQCCFIRDLLTYSCNAGFQLEGEQAIECNSEGGWNASRPLCRPTSDFCDTPPAIKNGAVSGDKEGDFFRPYDEVEVVCRPGYTYKGPTPIVMCEEETGWEEEFGECVETFCDLPESLENGTVLEMENTNLTSFSFNFEITYICDKGYRLIGDSWRFCDVKGWSGTNPHCEEIHCPDPGVPEHGRRIGDQYKSGAKVIFSCYTGYDLIGSFERYCLPNGQWSGELARCDHKDNYCPDPGIPVNGMKNSSRYDMGEFVQFRCKARFTLLGSEVLECLPNRTWTDAEPKCMGPYDFDNGAQVKEALSTAIAEKEKEQERQLQRYRDALFQAWHNGIRPRARIIDINFPGRLVFYFAFDVSGSVGPKNFRKSVDFAKAIVRRIGISEHGARAGALTFSSKVEINFLPLTYQTTEDVLNALDKLNYTGGGTSASSALSTIRKVLIPTTQAVLFKKGQKSIIFILTDGKANMGGDPQNEAQLLKEEVRAEIYCVGITSKVMQDSLYKIASEPKDEHVFILQNYASMSDIIQAITIGTIDYSRCGMGQENIGKKMARGRVVGGQKNMQPWPWMTALYFTEPDSQAELKCGGSIIHKEFILTAAHCMYTKTFALRNKNEIIVKLGLTNVQNQTNLQEMEVEDIYTHPQYKIGFFDYDVAVLRLKRPIEFSTFIRPICLPPQDLPANTTLYREGQYSIATGWGHAGVVGVNEMVQVRTEDVLKEVVLPVQSAESCNRSAQQNMERERKLQPDSAHTFTERMMCAGDGTGVNDACGGDSGGPLMQSQLNEEGYTYWTQVGIVSFGFGCGLPNTYGYYSHVHTLRPWIMDTINTESD